MARIPRSPVRWEHALLPLPENVSESGFIEWLNGYGAHGWELAHFSPDGGGVVILKREILASEGDGGNEFAMPGSGEGWRES